MKKQDLVNAVSRRSGVGRDVVRAVLDATCAATREALVRGDDVFLFGLGKLEVSSRGAKKARNIWTKETVIVPPRRVAVYRQSTSIEHALNHDAADAAAPEEAADR